MTTPHVCLSPMSETVLGDGLQGEVKQASSIRDPSEKVAVKSFSFGRMYQLDVDDLISEVEIYLCLDHPHITRLLKLDHLTLLDGIEPQLKISGMTCCAVSCQSLAAGGTDGTSHRIWPCCC